MNINIFGSTGVIGKNTLELIDQKFNAIKINLLCAKSNFKLLRNRLKYEPKYAFLYDLNNSNSINKKIGNTKLLNFIELQNIYHQVDQI